MASGAYVKHAEWLLAIFLVDANRAMQDDQGARRRQRSRRHTRQWSRRGRERPRNPQWRPLVAAQSEQVAAIGMDGRSAIIWTAPIVGRSRYAVGTCFVTCNGHTEISESVQIVLDPVFDVESDGVIHFL